MAKKINFSTRKKFKTTKNPVFFSVRKLHFCFKLFFWCKNWFFLPFFKLQIMLHFWNYTFFLRALWMMKKDSYKFTFLCNKSSANCNPTAFMSVFCKADVIYMCMSKKRSIAPPCSACSISNCESKLTNHSKDLWSRLIQKKST